MDGEAVDTPPDDNHHRVVVEDAAEDSEEEDECRVCRGPAEDGWVQFMYLERDAKESRFFHFSLWKASLMNEFAAGCFVGNPVFDDMWKWLFVHWVIFLFVFGIHAKKDD